MPVASLASASSLCLLLLLSTAPALQQSPPKPAPAVPEKSGTPSGQTSRRPAPLDSVDDSPNSPNSPAKLLKYNHEETLKDIEKLVKLTADIQEEVKNAGENVLPLNTLKKLDEVEKLTRKIRGKIKQ